jgi:hypothetical protein
MAPSDRAEDGNQIQREQSQCTSGRQAKVAAGRLVAKADKRRSRFGQARIAILLVGATGREAAIAVAY